MKKKLTTARTRMPRNAGRAGMVAVLYAAAAAAQTPTQPLSPGQTQTNGTSTQVPATTTQPTAGQNAAPGTTLPGSPGALGTPGQGPITALPVGNQAPAAGQAVTLQQALALAQQNEPAFAAAAAASKVADLDHSIARASLLPTAIYHNQYLFTSSNHSGPRDIAAATPQSFIANNAVHEYVSQASVTETLGLLQYNALSRADAASAIARAELEVARRGLTSTVVGLFYTSVTAEGKIAIGRRALAEANDFIKQTQERETEREAAHADVVRAQLAQQQRQRDLADTELAAEKAKLDLAVLLFPDARTAYSVTLPDVAPLPTREAVDAAAAKGNPELASAVASLRSSNLGVTAARAAYLPDLVMNYSYGIDSAQFAVNAPDGTRNLGYSASVTLDIPIFDWLATEHKVKQAQILRDAAKVALTATQRRLVANLEEFYNELRVAHDQLDSLQLSVNTARESLRLTRLRYSNGESTVLEVVDAQNSLTTSELALQDGTVRYQLALANLQTLTGTL